VDGRVRLVDVAPTVLREARVPVTPVMQGQALQDLVKPEKGSGATATQETGFGDRPAYAETDYAQRAFGWSALQAWRAGKYLYIQAPKRELYDQSSDPLAQHNLTPTGSAVADTMASRLNEFHAKTGSTSAAPAQLDPAQAEQLRALGYLASDAKGVTNSSQDASIDPKDKIEIANTLHQALIDTENDDYKAAIPKLEKVIQQEPNTHAAYLELGRAWIHEKQFEKALPMLQKAVEIAPESAMAHYELGLALVKTAQWEGAAPEFEAAVARAPKSPEMHFYLGAVYARLKRVPDAAQEFETTLRLDPSHYQANLIYGHMLVLEHEPASALPKLLQAAKVQPELGEPHKYLMEAYLQLGQEAKARHEQALFQELKTNP
jgi:tetratricopeptide (TPR) repeat protein